MNPIQSAKQRIDEMIGNYQQDDSKMTHDYLQTLNFVKAHMTDFFNRYEQNSQLTASDVAQSVQTWDIQQWQQMLNELGYKNFSDDAKKRANAITATAAVSVGMMMASIPKLGLVSFTENNIKVFANRMVTDAKEQIQHLKRHIKRVQFINKVKNNSNSIITDPDNVKIWSENLWHDMDGLAGQVQTAVNQHIRHGMKLDDLSNMLTIHDNPSQFNPNQSIADRIKQSQFNARRIIRTESSKLVNQANIGTYRQLGSKSGRWVTEPGACDNCLDTEAKNPYSYSELEDMFPLHPNDNCYIVADDLDPSEYA